MSYNTNCIHFSGYKPCTKNAICNTQCPHSFVAEKNILIIHLGAMGAVLRSTSLLISLHKKYPHSAITWITDAPSDQLLKNNSYIHRVVKNNYQDIQSIKTLEFDVAIVIDKSPQAVSILREFKCKEHFGFTTNFQNNAILPATPAARELWELGLDNHKKFYINQKTENQLVHEALELSTYTRSEYIYNFSETEKIQAERRRSEWLGEAEMIVGVNTGCSPVVPYKKLSIDGHKRLISELSQIPNIKIILLGGPEDEARNIEIAKNISQVILSPTQKGLRDGMISMQACDVVVSGDSLGMHMAIALKKYVVAWFGPTCAQEIDLYERGFKVVSTLACAPCWKRSCNNSKMCYDEIDLNQIIFGVYKGIEFCKKNTAQVSSFKQPLLEISS